MDDTISRQSAIDEIIDSFKCGDYLKATLRRLEALPSAEPKLDINDMPEQGDSAKFGVKTGETCADCISRRQAIDAFADWFNGTEYTIMELTFSECKSVIKSLPSAQSERKRGRWIVYYECPKCGEITKDFTEYCPFCNADMIGEGDE